MSFSSDVPLQTNQLPISVEFPKGDDPAFDSTLSLAYKRIVNSVNSKEGALYFLQELANFQQYFYYSNPATFTVDPNRFRNGYRTTYDLLKLNNGVPIPVATTSYPVDTIINGILNPVHGFGGATIAGPIFVFTGMFLDIQFDNTVPNAQKLKVTNNTGSVLTQCYFTIEYLKN